MDDLKKLQALNFLNDQDLIDCFNQFDLDRDFDNTAFFDLYEE